MSYHARRRSSRRHRRPQLGPRRHASSGPPARAGCSTPLGNGNAGLSRVRPGRPAGVRLQRVRRPHRGRVRRRRCRPGRAMLGVRFRRTGNGATATARRRRRARCGSAEIPFAMRVISSVGSSVGYDHGMPVSDRYAGPFPFEGALHAVDIQLVSASAPPGARRRRRRGALRDGPAVATAPGARRSRRVGGHPAELRGDAYSGRGSSKGATKSGSASQKVSYPTAPMAGTDGPAELRARERRSRHRATR